MAHDFPVAKAHPDIAPESLPNTSNIGVREKLKFRNCCSKECLNCLFKAQCVIKGLLLSDVGAFSSSVTHKRPIRKGSHLYRQDGDCDSLYIVHSGAVKLYRLSETGDERVWGFHLPGEIIGTDGLYNHQYVNSAVALDTTSVCELSLKNLAHLFKEQDSFVLAFLSRVYGEVLESQQMTIQSHKPSGQQLAQFLLDLSLRYQCRQMPSETIHLVMTRKDIASYLGMAVETVSRQITLFQERGWVEVKNREVTFIDITALRACAEAEE